MEETKFGFSKNPNFWILGVFDLVVGFQNWKVGNVRKKVRKVN